MLNLHKLLFPEKERELKKLQIDSDTDRKDYIAVHEVLMENRIENTALKSKIKELEENTPDKLENLMRASLGLPYIDFENIERDTEGNDNPPHYLKGLDDDERKAYISQLAQIWKNDKFQAVLRYNINVLGNYTIQKAPDESMKNGRIGIIAIRGFRKDFEDAYAEYMESAKEPEDFNKFSVLGDD